LLLENLELNSNPRDAAHRYFLFIGEPMEASLEFILRFLGF